MPMFPANVIDFPLTFYIGPISISSHLFFEVLAFFIGFRYFLYLRKQQTDYISTDNRIWILVGATFGALVFSRLVGALEHPHLFITGGGEYGWLYYYKNKTIVGALLGGLWCVEITKLILGEKKSSGDLFTFPLMLAMIIGRLGCFTTGIYEQTYGLPTDLPWAMDLGDGVLRHPTALYEIVFLLLLWLFIWGIEKRYTLVNGARFKIFLISYFVYRLIIESIRPGIVVLGGLTSIQWACVVGLFTYLPTFIKGRAAFIQTKIKDNPHG